MWWGLNSNPGWWCGRPAGSHPPTPTSCHDSVLALGAPNRAFPCLAAAALMIKPCNTSTTKDWKMMRIQKKIDRDWVAMYELVFWILAKISKISIQIWFKCSVFCLPLILFFSAWALPLWLLFYSPLSVRPQSMKWAADVARGWEPRVCRCGNLFVLWSSDEFAEDLRCSCVLDGDDCFVVVCEVFGRKWREKLSKATGSELNCRSMLD